MIAKDRAAGMSRRVLIIEKKVENALRQLMPHEEYVLRVLYGIVDTRQKSDNQVAWFRFAPTAARRIEERALRKLRLTAVSQDHGTRERTR